MLLQILWKSSKGKQLLYDSYETIQGRFSVSIPIGEANPS